MSCAGKGVVGRFAPSPSGGIHLGNLFSALIAWLEVRSAGGTMLLRIEDLDPDRCRPEYAERLRRELDAVGLDWDREQRPQSLGNGDYAAAFDRLDALGLVYPCYCSRAELHAASAPHAADGQVVYSGICRRLTPAERAAQTRIPAWRVAVPDRRYTVTDGIMGRYGENLKRDCGDFIIRRSDGVYAYQLAVVVDDAAAGVTRIVRGRDLLSSTPRQRYLGELLGLPLPEYCHVPLLCDDSGRRLSKRDGDLEVGALLEKMPPEALLGRLAWAAGILPEYAPTSAKELVGLYRRELLRREDIRIREYF